MSSPDRDARAWLINLLNTDLTLQTNAPAGAYPGKAPDGTPNPVIVVTGTDPQHVRTHDRHRIMSTGLWRILVWFDEETATAALAATDRIDELLDRTTVTHNGTTITVTGESNHNQTVANDGDLFHAEGGWFRFWAH